MRIGGLQKFSLLDYPGHLAAIIFTQGCNFRCQFCYNPMLVWPARRNGGPIEQDKLTNTPPSDSDGEQKGRPELVAEDDLFVFLKSRLGKLDAVVVSGGEPTSQPDLPEFLARIKDLGYRLKLDTNGTDPAMVKKLIDAKLLDYIAMDLKAAPKRYGLVTGVEPDLNRIKTSIALIKAGNLPYEFRTTLVPELIFPADIGEIGEMIRGAELWFLQPFKSDTTLLNRNFETMKPYSGSEMENMRAEGAKFVKSCRLR